MKKFLSLLNFQIFQSKNVQSSPEAPHYSDDFLSNARRLLYLRFSSDYLTLLTEGFQPPPEQKRDWQELLYSEIEKKNLVFIQELIDKKYDFQIEDGLPLFKLAVELQTTYVESAEKKEKMRLASINILEALGHHPFMFNTLVNEVWKLKREAVEKYKIPKTTEDQILDSHNAGNVIHAVEGLVPYLRALHFMIQPSEAAHKQISLLNFVHSAQDALQPFYTKRNKSPAYSSDREMTSSPKYSKLAEHLSAAIREKEKEKMDLMKSELSSTHFSDKLKNKVNALREEKKFDSQLPDAAQPLIDKISALYQQLCSVKDSETEFNIKNIVDKTVPSIVEAYLEFPKEYRATFKNDKGQTPEDILIQNLQTNVAILENFQHISLTEKQKKMEIIQTYSEHKRMSLSK